MTGRLCVLVWEISLLNLLGTYSQATDTYYTVEGQFYQLKCDVDLAENQTITWSWDHNHALNLTTQHMTHEDNSLWFLPVYLSDSGSYTCSNGANVSKTILHVENGLCPRKSDIKRFQNGTLQTLSCGQSFIFTLDDKARVNWFKDCKPLNLHKKTIITNVTDSNAGQYTCQIHFIYKKKNYTASRTIQLDIKDEPVLLKPMVIRPKGETVSVKPGLKTTLECYVFLGITENAKTEALVYWTFNNTFIEEHKHLHQNLMFEKKKHTALFGRSTLFIDEVQPEFFHAPFQCIVGNPVGQDAGFVHLTPSSQSGLHTYFLICLTLSMVVIFLVICFVFKVDMVLAFRGLREALGIKNKSDGRLYDAYVSYLQGGTACSSEAEHFVMQTLPEVLEGLHGYKLFIRGRDDLPGEVAYDVIADTVRKSRRMIIILTAQSPVHWNTKDPLNIEPSGYDQQVGLYDALIQDTLPVILVEMNKDIDYSLLPESVRYVKQKQGSLRWRPRNGSSAAFQNRSFWKLLRYCMSEIKSNYIIP